MKYSVLTYIFGDYDKVHEIINQDKDVEYVLVTDNKNLTSSTWNIVFDESLNGLEIFDKCYHVRFHPFKYVSNDIVVRIDGSLELIGDLSKIINVFEEEQYDIMVKVHNYNDSIQKEYYRWVKFRNYDFNQAIHAIELLRKIGLTDAHKGLIELCITIQRNNKYNNDLNRLVYSFLKLNGNKDGCDRLDQPIFSFILARFFDNMKIGFLPQMINDYRFGIFKWYTHDSDDVPMVERENIFLEKYYFNNKEINFIEI